MGVDGQSSYTLDDPQITVAPAPALDELLVESQTKRPELAAVDAKIKSDGEIIAFYKSTKWPKFTGLFSGGLLRFSELTPGKLLLGAFGFDLPIYTGGRIKNEIVEAQANLERTHAARAELAQDIRFQVQRAYNELVSAGETVRGSEQVVRQAREALRLAQVRYRVQLGSFVELTTAETAASGAEAQYAEALYNYKVAEVRLDYVAGRRYRP
jgi:outer membrane protein TolC